MGHVPQADMQPLVACQIARLVILPRGAEPRGETLQIAMFGRWDLPQLDAQHAPSARRVSRQKADALRAAGPPGPPPSIQEFASLAIEERNDRQIVGDRPRWSTSQRQPRGYAKPDPGGSGRIQSVHSIIRHIDPILWFRPRKTSMFGRRNSLLWLHDTGICVTTPRIAQSTRLSEKTARPTSKYPSDTCRARKLPYQSLMPVYHETHSRPTPKQGRSYLCDRECNPPMVVECKIPKLFLFSGTSGIHNFLAIRRLAIKSRKSCG